jgi:hypothetical protein
MLRPFVSAAWPLALMACSGLPASLTRPTDVAGRASSRPPTDMVAPTATKDRAATGTSGSMPASGKPRASTSPLSYALTLHGQVRLDVAPLVAAGLAQTSAAGARLISNNGGTVIAMHGGDVISDHGAGLISEGAFQIIASQGLGILANNGATLLAINVSALAGKTKYRLADVDSGGLTPVQGLAVIAIDMATGKPVTSPVATDAQGRYSLGFVAAPSANVGVLAVVMDAHQDVKRVYGTLVTPHDGTSVLTTDSTRSIATYLLGVMPGRVQPIIDARKLGKTADAFLEAAKGEPQGYMLLKSLDAAFANADPGKLTAADQDGAVARGIAERIVAYIDLDQAHYVSLLAFADDLRLYGASRQPPLPGLVDQVLVDLRSQNSDERITTTLVAAGMSPEQAMAKAKIADDLGNLVVKDVGRAVLAHQADILLPLAPILGP